MSFSQKALQFFPEIQKLENVILDVCVKEKTNSETECVVAK